MKWFVKGFGVAIGTVLCMASSSQAAVLFTDTFDSGASPLWGNEIGAWAAADGLYGATIAAPNDYPSSHSSLPFVLTDFIVEVDVVDIQDGGFWLRSAAAPASAIGRVGVLLVTGGRGGAGEGLYWHIVSDGSSYGTILNESVGLFTPGASDAHLTIAVVGDTYAVYVDGSSAAASQLSTTAFASGQFGLFDSGPGVERFDSVTLSPVPEAPAPAMLLLGAVSVASAARRARRRTRA